MDYAKGCLVSDKFDNSGSELSSKDDYLYFDVPHMSSVYSYEICSTGPSTVWRIVAGYEHSVLISRTL